MNARTLEPMLINATIKAIDGISKKAADAEKSAEGMAGKLLARWNDMERPEKEHVVGIVIATATTAVTALAAMKSKRTLVKQAGKAGKKIVKKAVRKARD